MKLRAYLLMLFVVAVWGSTFVLIKGALADATPAAFNLVRMTLAFLVLAAAYHRSWRGIRRWQIASGALVGLCLAVGYQFQTTGLARTTPSKSAFITGLVVVLVPLFSIFPGLRTPGARPPRWNAFLGAALAFAGILLLTAPAATDARSQPPRWASLPASCPNLSSINVGDLLTFGCAIGFAFHCIALSHVSPRIGYRPLAILQVGFCAIFMAISLPFIEHPHITWTPRLAHRACHRRCAGHRRGVLHSKLGAVGLASHAHGPAAHARTGLRLDHIISDHGRASGPAPRIRRTAHPRRNRAHRAGPATACSHRA
jgi:drug/metabolite transporter (DMT)-like permease